MKRIFFFLSISVALVSPAKAVEVESGNSFLHGCEIYAGKAQIETPLNALDAGTCAGAIMATWDMLSLNGGICFSNGVTQNQIAKVVYKYMDEHPEKLNQKLTYLIATALKEAWPCTKEK